MAAAAALRTLSVENPCLLKTWDLLQAEYERYCRIDDWCSLPRYIHVQEVHLGGVFADRIAETWSMHKSMLDFFERFSGIQARRALMKRIVSPFFGESVTDDILNMLLAQYQKYAEDALWDEPRPNLNKRMKQFAREEGYVVKPAEPVPAPTEPVAEPIAEPARPTLLYCTDEYELFDQEGRRIDPWVPPASAPTVPAPTEPIAEPVPAPIRSIWTSTWLYKTVKDMTEEEFKEYEEWCEADEDEDHVKKNEWRYR